MTELKPCPFCGSIADLNRSETDGDYPQIYYICCENYMTCSCRTTMFDTKKEAIEVWNKRPESDLEKIKKLCENSKNCFECSLRARNGYGCMLYHMPKYWDLDKINNILEGE